MAKPGPGLGAAKQPGFGAAQPAPSAAVDTSDLQVMKHTSAPNPAPAPPPIPTDPKQFQQYLNDHGAQPPLKVDGVIGPKTLAAAQALNVAIPDNLAPAPPAAPTAPPPSGNNQPLAGGGQQQEGVAAPPPSITTDQLRARYGYLGALLDAPDIAALIQQRVSDPAMTDEQFLAKLYDTPTWRTTQTSARNFIGLQGQDPAGLQAQIDQQKADVDAQAKTLGITIAPDRLTQIATDSIRLGWDSTQLRNAVAAEFRYKPGGQGGTVGAVEATAKALAQQYGVTKLLDDATLASWDQQIASGTMTADGLKQNIVNLAQQYFPGLAGQITVDNPTSNLLSPYRAVAQNELGVNGDTIDFTQPMWMKAVDNVDDKGNHLPMSLADWAQTLRSDPSYGWDRTPNGVAAGYAVGNTVAQAMGLRP